MNNTSGVIIEPEFYGFDVLACAELGSFEIEARAIIPWAIIATAHHLITSATFTIANEELATCEAGSDGSNVKVSLCSRLPTESYLPIA